MFKFRSLVGCRLLILIGRQVFFVGVKESTGHKCSTLAILKGPSSSPLLLFFHPFIPQRLGLKNWSRIRGVASVCDGLDPFE